MSEENVGSETRDEVECWVIDRYGIIHTDSVDMPQFGMKIASAAVSLYQGVEIGMGPSRQLAIHDLYLRLTLRPELKTSLPPWWQERYENWKRTQ